MRLLIENQLFWIATVLALGMIIQQISLLLMRANPKKASQRTDGFGTTIWAKRVGRYRIHLMFAWIVVVLVFVICLLMIATAGVSNIHFFPPPVQDYCMLWDQNPEIVVTIGIAFFSAALLLWLEVFLVKPFLGRQGIRRWVWFFWFAITILTPSFVGYTCQCLPIATQGQNQQLDFEWPKAAEPKAAEPKAAEPKAAEPKAAEPKAAEPKAAEPKAAEPKPKDGIPLIGQIRKYVSPKFAALTAAIVVNLFLGFSYWAWVVVAVYRNLSEDDRLKGPVADRFALLPPTRSRIPTQAVVIGPRRSGKTNLFLVGLEAYDHHDWNVADDKREGTTNPVLCRFVDSLRRKNDIRDNRHQKENDTIGSIGKSDGGTDTEKVSLPSNEPKKDTPTGIKTAKPKTAKPKTAKPKAVEPKAVEHKAADPKTAEPKKNNQEYVVSAIDTGGENLADQFSILQQSRVDRLVVVINANHLKPNSHEAKISKWNVEKVAELFDEKWCEIEKGQAIDIGKLSSNYFAAINLATTRTDVMQSMDLKSSGKYIPLDRPIVHSTLVVLNRGDTSQERNQIVYDKLELEKLCELGRSIAERFPLYEIGNNSLIPRTGPVAAVKMDLVPTSMAAEKSKTVLSDGIVGFTSKQLFWRRFKKDV